MKQIQLLPGKKKFILVRIIILVHNDHLGSTSVITNESGAVVEETFYDPYGTILEGGSESRFDYEGKEFSSVTEDYDYNFRKYNPEVGLFTQPERLFPNLYDPQQLNRYRFERNNPYKYVDPNGKFALPVIAVIGLAIGVMMLTDYGLEIYHGFREGASFGESYEAGASRSGQDVGGALTFTNPGKTAELGVSVVAERVSYALTAIQIIEEIWSGRKSSYLKIQETKQASIYSPILPTDYAPSINNYGNIFNNYVSSNNNFLSNTFGGYNQINLAAQVASQSSANGGCMCLAHPTEKISTSQSSTGGSSVLQSIKKVAGNVWGGVKNILGRIF
ncbi:hypothetical protein J4429_03025 [Candidatus Pacearchaeota archaeon]|nr:hypothetical protein [Candidatus Pacearchaeota archaeon]